MKDEFIKEKLKELEELVQNFKQAKEDLLKEDSCEVRNENIALCNLGIECTHKMIVAIEKEDFKALDALMGECHVLMLEAFKLFSGRLCKKQ